jgi:hypothetical protein
MSNRPSLWISIAAVAAVAVGLSACTVGSSKLGSSPPSSATRASTPPSSSTTSTAAPTATQASPRTVAELKSALLALDDLPSGFAIEPADGGGADNGSSSSTDPKCAALVKLTNAKVAPGSRGSANVSFSGGQDGPFVDESIDALGSADAVVALQASFKSAVMACPRLVVTIPGQGSSTMKVAEVSAPKFGDHPFAARVTAIGGPLAGLEMTQVISGVRDVVVSISFVSAVPDDVDGGAEAAVGKAEDVLGGASPGA